MTSPNAPSNEPGRDGENFDAVTQTETTGHSWDGIRELNTPLPRWWLWTFYATVIWALVYVILYPAIPLLNSATGGVLGYSSRGEVAEDLQAAFDAQADLRKAIADSDLQAIADNDDLRRFAAAGGKSSFAVNCSQCHGSGAQGFVGYPNLNDDEWLWGGSLDDIYATIRHGIRFEQDDDTRISEMPAFGRDELLSSEEVIDVSHFVISLSGTAEDSAAAARGAEIYAENCAVCHGEQGQGDPTQGAPNLNNAIWLYGDDFNTIRDMVNNARAGVMPAWGHRLDDVTLKQLTVYVHGLGGGQ